MMKTWKSKIEKEDILQSKYVKEHSKNILNNQNSLSQLIENLELLSNTLHIIAI
jgi:hypothetical protein